MRWSKTTSLASYCAAHCASATRRHPTVAWNRTCVCLCVWLCVCVCGYVGEWLTCLHVLRLHSLHKDTVDELDFCFSDEPAAATTTSNGQDDDGEGDALYRRKSDMTLTPSREAMADVPMAYLATNKQYFDQLFDLLTFGPDVSEKVWRILQMLPTNGHKLRQLRALDGATGHGGWERLLDSKSTFTLLYSLQIVDSFLRVRRGLAHPLSLCQFPEHGCVHVQTSSPDNDRSVRDTWCRTFVRAGGVQHLVHVLASGQQVGPGRSQCTAVLMSLVHFLLGLDRAYVYVDGDGVGERHADRQRTLRGLREHVRIPDGSIVR